MKKFKFYVMFLAADIKAGFVPRVESLVDLIFSSPNHLILETALNSGTNFFRTNK
jgi:hypothetical protein